MENGNTYLVTEKIQETIERLCLRISDRFPGSGLCDVGKRLHDISLETNSTLEWIARPNYLIRVLASLVIAGIVFVTFYSASAVELTASTIGVSDLVQMFGSALEGMAIAGAGIIFIITFENRTKRTKIISSINRLRCVSHIIDIHQLTKDPEALRRIATATPNSPKRDLTGYELGRYLNYCSEMLALIGKLGFLYVQKFPDAVATDAVNDLEALTTDLSRKIWQKIMLIDTKK
jgi:hypothetical protein